MSRLIFIGAASAAALALAACGDNTDANNTPATTNDTALNDTTATDTTAAPAAPAAPVTDTREESVRFVNAVGQASLAEIQTSEIALERSKNTEVKAFAQKIIDDHKAAADKLNKVAMTASLPTPPTVLDDFHKRRLDDLNEDPANQNFDADYVSMQVDMHNDAIELVKSYADDSDAMPELKAFAMEVLPTLQMHKDMAEKLRGKVS